jgi:phage terminase large subunit-like protein
LTVPTLPTAPIQQIPQIQQIQPAAPTSTYFERAKAYAHRVDGGQETAGHLERLAAQRFLQDLARAGTDAFPYVLNDAAGARACMFIERLPHIKGEWARPVYANGVLRYATIQLEDWQIFCDYQLFAWVHRDTGLRRFRRSYEEVARKNAKSTRAAARALFLLAADREPGSHCYSAATTGEQAREVFDVARNMALRESSFRDRWGVTVGKHDITIPETASNFRPLNAEGSTLDGLNVHCAIVDELHAHKRRDLWDVIDSATGARSQPLLCGITTAGSDRAGICYELRSYTVKILEGVLQDETWFGAIYTIDKDDDWQDPAVWRKANPNLGISVKTDDMQAACSRARSSPSQQANFLTKRLNVWVSSDQALFDMQAWARSARPELRMADLAHLPAYAGLDLASKIDIAAGPLLFHDEAADHYYLITRGRFWLPERAVEEGSNSQYTGWVRSGWIMATDGEVTDFDAIEDRLRQDQTELQDLREVGFDPWQATHLASHMLAEGVPMVEVRQTVQNLSEPLKTLMAWNLQGKLTHDANPAMDWMMSNVVGHFDAKENVYPRKERPEQKIDGPVALLIAMNRALSNEPKPDISEFLNNLVSA